MKLGFALLAMVGSSWPLAAFADERVSVRWTAPAECPTETNVREQVLARLPPGTPLRVDAKATRVQGGYHLALTVATDAATGEREVDARDCKTLVSSMAVIAAMAAHEALAAGPKKPSQLAPPSRNTMRRDASRASSASCARFTRRRLRTSAKPASTWKRRPTHKPAA